MKKKSFTAVLVQGGLQVARVDASTRDAAEREIQHYEMMYSEDGPCEIKRNYKNPHIHVFREVVNGRSIVKDVPKEGKDLFIVVGDDGVPAASISRELTSLERAKMVQRIWGGRVIRYVPKEEVSA